MTPLTITGCSISAALAVLAWLVAARDPRHRALAGFLTFNVAADVARFALLTARAHAVRPYTGVHRLGFHVDQFLLLGFFALLLATALHYFLGRFRWLFAAVWLPAFLVCLDYPTVRGPTLAMVYQATAGVCVVGAWLTIAVGILTRKNLDARLAHLVIIALTATETISLLGLASTDYFARWPLIDWSTTFLLAFCAVAHLWWLRMGHRRLVTLP